MSGGFLERMAESSRRRSATAKERMTEDELRHRVERLPPPPAIGFSPDGFDLIAEIKPRSPSEGRLAGADFSPVALAGQYAAAGAAALSVLTEPSRFGGSLELLADIAKAAGGTPVMRKDFLVDPYQVLEARLHGASGVLLIVGMTDDANTEAMLGTALACGMFSLLEAFGKAELERAREMAGRVDAPRDKVLLGLNCRDLRTLKVDRGRFGRVEPQDAGGFRMIAESGIEDAGQAGELAARGWDGLLIGTALMRAEDPRALAAGMLAEGRLRRQP
ncbi:MAG: indole-3-glycerol-phosphate synthase [Gammaproteobacteria bacterium]|nr:indole-3-glycerol-phosphate synthase [Gammaproteobacteria bacterium]MDE0413815.1 indole-3-glycerol-phosphate synthase [Gammaproteobacteria bacterium]